MKKTFFTTFAALVISMMTLGTTTFANTTAECLGINDQDDNTGNCLNYLYTETWEDPTIEITIDDISFQAGEVTVDVCYEGPMSYFDNRLYVELEIPTVDRYWKKLTEETFKDAECQTISFEIVDNLNPQYYLLTAKVTTNLPHVPNLAQDEIARSSKWEYIAAPLRTYSGKRLASYPVYANERRSELFPYQQSETHLRTEHYYPTETIYLHKPRFTTMGRGIHIYKDKFYPTFPKDWNAMSANYYYVP
jgi:hypothetical protein